ncbi:MAG: type II secretion system F family protein [Candidatus Omnitrophota bacterium]
MAVYLYEAKDKQGKSLKSRVEAQNRQEALAMIDSLALFPIWIEEKKGAFKASSKVPLKNLVEFSRQLSTLINSGATIFSALNTLVSETKQAGLTPVLMDVILQVKEGVSFSQALEKYPHVFSRFYISLVKTGEESGTLGENLKRIADFLEEDMDFRVNLVSILVYPFLIIGVGIVTVFILLKFVIPKLVNIFEEIGQSLPLPTVILKNISSIFSKYWILLGVLSLLSFFIIRKFFSIPKNKLKWNKFKLDIPLVGNLFRKIEICRLARTLAILLRNGVAMDVSLRVLTATISNIFFQKQIIKIENEIKEGFSLNEAMRRTKAFPNIFLDAVTVGEESATLDIVLENLSNDYSKQINREIKSFLSLLEPWLILGIGLGVGVVILSMLLPIFLIDFNF